MIFLYIFGAIAVIVIFFFIVVSMQSGDFNIKRSAVMAAPASAIFEQVNDFHNWTAWSPWEGIDPNLKRTYEGPSSGVGAIYSWVGDRKVGQGRMTIIESRPSDLIRIRLEFLKPFAATNSAEFTFKPSGNNTEVTWNMSGKNKLIARAFCMFMDMDKMVGGQFEKGLENLRSVVERKTAGALT